MIINTDNTNKVISVSFSTIEWDTLVWAKSVHGEGVLESLLRNWLKSMWLQQEQKRLDKERRIVPAALTDTEVKTAIVEA